MSRVVLKTEMGTLARTRWLEAQSLEAAPDSAEDLEEWLQVRRVTWKRLVDYLARESLLKESRRILDIGGKSTTIFLALPEGQRYAVDPVYKDLFLHHPFLRDLDEYRGVHFIAVPIEESDLEPFDLIFSINMLDHVEDVSAVASKIQQLLVPGGKFILIVDCYADGIVRDLVRWFDLDVPHPHHFLREDVVRIFSGLHLCKQDMSIYDLFFTGRLFRSERSDISIYEVGRLFRRFGSLLDRYDKKHDLFFAAKFAVCYGLALLVALLRRTELPIHPLKKPRLFVFEKASVANSS